MNNYIQPLESYEQHEQRHQALHQAVQNAYIENEQTRQMRQAYLHHLKQNLCLPHPKWDKKENWR